VRYSRKLRGSKFLKMDDSLIAEAVSSFSAPLVSSGAVTDLVGPSSELVDSEEEDEDFWVWKTEYAGVGMGKTEIFLTLWVISPCHPFGLGFRWIRWGSLVRGWMSP
jgi:hypothetical protein